MSRYGRWVTESGLPAFVYDADLPEVPEWDPLVAEPTRLHWVSVGNRRIQLVCRNDGTVGLLDEADGLRFLTEPGTGVSVIEEDGIRWGTSDADRPSGDVPERTFGPTWFRVRTASVRISVDRTMLCPEGELPWVLVRVRLHSTSADTVALRHTEEWAVRPRFLNLGGTPDSRVVDAERGVRFRIERGARSILAHGERTQDGEELATAGLPQVFGEPVTMSLEAAGGTVGEPSSEGAPHPVLRLTTPVELAPGETVELWYRFGVRSDPQTYPPPSDWDRSIRELRDRLPTADPEWAPEASREVPWHAALLTGGACADRVLSGHTLNQASAYSYVIGFNGAARDPLQHALPLVYSEPDLALSVLRNTLAWAGPDGDLPYALDGAKRPWTSLWQPSDQNLWAMWLATEYAAATGDLASFDEPLRSLDASSAPLLEHLRRGFRFFVDGVGTGEHGHVRMRNADWNDIAVVDSGVERDVMVADGESVLNSAMASWVLPVFAGLCDRLGSSDTAREARELGETLRDRVAGEWNGRWFRRAYAPGRGPIGDDDLWLEVQPWAILCGAASDEQARQLLGTIDELCRDGSPLGARVRHPSRTGDATDGGVWFSINMTLVWAAMRVDPELARDEWRRMTLAAHASAYPDVWEGTLSGPDAYNAPESERPGRTWGSPELGVAMQSWPVNNLHSHAQPLLAYLRLCGVEPRPDGALAVGGGSFSSRTFTLRPDGSGRLDACGHVVVRGPRGETSGGPGDVTW